MAAVVKNLSSADQKLSYTQQKQIAKAKDAYNAAKAAGDTAGMEKAHADAEAIRISEGYYGGTDGTGRTKTTGWKYTGGKLDTGSLSETDRGLLSREDQERILSLKEAYKNATDPDEKAYIHSLAEGIRNYNHYSLGESGKDSDYRVLPYGQGGKSAAQLDQELAAFEQQWWNPVRGWTNGYDVSMNTRSKANMIRQQMLANDQAMTDENREVLHAENLKLADLLYKYTGQSAKNTYFNEDTGRWETWNSNVGYGYDVSGKQANIRNDWKKFYGYTDEEIEKWANDTSRYFNFVDQNAAARNSLDESSGYTGQYTQFVNGPYSNYVWGTRGWQHGDDEFNDEGISAYMLPEYDENGNIIKRAPRLKNDNNVSEYTAQFLPGAVNGMLVGKGASTPLITEDSGPNNLTGQKNYYLNYGINSPNRINLSGASGGAYDDYLRQIYGEALAAQLKVLQSGYEQNLSDLDASQQQIDGAYTEQKRQTTGQAAQNAAAWREVANAYGLNSGAVGQASLAQRNQLQNDLNKLNAAQAAARTELQRQRMLLGQQYQLAIEQAVAENNGQLAKSLYEEAVRAEEALQKQEQFYANLALQYSKSMMSFAKSAGLKKA